MDNSNDKQTHDIVRANSLPPPDESNVPTLLLCKTPVTVKLRFPHNLPGLLNLVLGQDGKAYSERRDARNPYVLPVGSRALSNVIREIAQQDGVNLRKADLADINHYLQAHAEMAGNKRDIWNRVAPVDGGVEIDLGDDKHARARITAGNVEIIAKGSDTLFFRPTVSLPMVMPAEFGDLKLLYKYLNMSQVSATLFIAWLSYTLAHPKLPENHFVILVLQGGQGSGKSSLCKNIIQPLIDPSRIGVQIIPKNDKDLAIAAQNTHVLCYDNVRGITQAMSDLLCIAATGGALCNRQLYTDADQAIISLHVAVVLNGAHSFIDEPDLSQRCLTIPLLPIDETKRKSETDLVREFRSDLPVILRGLFNSIAEAFKYLPHAEITNPERMVDFVGWLAALEKAKGLRPGMYQEAYSKALRDGQLDSLLDNVLAATVLELVESLGDGRWSGTPAELLVKLKSIASSGTQKSRDWPLNPITLSKRLQSLEAGLLTQDISLEFRRGKNRNITIKSGVKNEKI